MYMQIPPMKELRKLMRIQALRCNVVYCQNGARLNVIPVLASRSQALRYVLIVNQSYLHVNCLGSCLSSMCFFQVLASAVGD